MQRSPLASALLLLAAPILIAAELAPGDVVRLSRRETLTAAGKNVATLPKGAELSVVKLAGDRVEVDFRSEAGILIPATASLEAVAPVPPDAWADVLSGVAAFRDGRYDLARSRLARAAQDAERKPMAVALSQRMTAAMGRQPVALQGLRDAAGQFAAAGHVSIAAGLDAGVDRLGGAGAPASKLVKADILPKAKAVELAMQRGRQALSQRKLAQAMKELDAGLIAEPGHAVLAGLRARAAKDLAAAEDCFADADKLRTRGAKGVIHALSSLDDGLRLAADHPKLLALKKEMQGEFEKRTSPQVDATFLAAAKAKIAKETLAVGRELYVERCTECHDLEMLDSRGLSGWQRTVGGMSKRAGLSAAEQAQVLEYIAAALTVVESADAR